VTTLPAVWRGRMHVEVPQLADLERLLVVISDDSCGCSCSSEDNKDEYNKTH
jgi:hypothetical protein